LHGFAVEFSQTVEATLKNSGPFTRVRVLAFASQAFAVLRPLFPIKPEPPFSGEAIVVRDDLVRKTNPAVADAQVMTVRQTRTAAALFLLLAIEDVRRYGLPFVASKQERLLEQAWPGVHPPWGSLKDLPQQRSSIGY
jgi:hypothetical protein